MAESDLDVYLALPDLERRFCEHMAGELAGHPIAALRAAGMSGAEPHLKLRAAGLLGNPSIKRVIRAFELADDGIPTRLECMRKLGSVARGEETEDVVYKGEVMEVRAPASARMRAAETLLAMQSPREAADGTSAVGVISDAELIAELSDIIDG